MGKEAAVKTIVGGLLTAALFYGLLAGFDALHMQLGELPSALLAGLCGFAGFWIAHNLSRRSAG